MLYGTAPGIACGFVPGSLRLFGGCSMGRISQRLRQKEEQAFGASPVFETMATASTNESN